MAKDTNSEFDAAAFWAKHRKTILGGVTAVAVVAGGGWFWTASRNLKESRAEGAYASAERTFYSGNAQLATTELTRKAAASNSELVSFAIART